MAEAPVAIIGGGIQGVCSAFSLARLGVPVTIFEAADGLLDRASYRSEGKIHLGFVYANDPTRRTADLMLESALRFGPLLENWIGPVDWDQIRSSPFSYVMLPDSQLTEEQLREHYHRIDQNYRERSRNDGLHYLGLTPETLLSNTVNGVTSSAAAAWLAKGLVVADTAEVAVDRLRFRNRLLAAVSANSRIRVHLQHQVKDITRKAGGFRVSSVDSSGMTHQTDFALVVNCSWTDRLRLDLQQGLEPDRKWVYRLKYRLLGRLTGASRRPSLTLALGPYGDFVTYPEDRVYISWYPVCMRGWSKELTPPEDWSFPCRSQTPMADAAEVLEGVMREFGAIIPAIHDVAVDDIGAGVIFSWGTRDIDDPGSELHSRSEIGVDGLDGYYTINTGKFTCAPLFADQLTARIQADGGPG